MLQSQILHKVYQILSFVATWPGVLLVLLVVAALLLRIRYRKGLRKVPGPFLASILPFDRLLTAATGRQQWRHIDYHERYGPFVRVGPNHVSISRGDYITQIYGIGNAFPKVCSMCTFLMHSRLIAALAEPFLYGVRRNLP